MGWAEWFFRCEAVNKQVFESFFNEPTLAAWTGSLEKLLRLLVCYVKTLHYDYYIGKGIVPLSYGLFARFFIASHL